MSVSQHENVISDVVLSQNQRSIYRQIKFYDRQGKIKTTEVVDKPESYRMLILPVTSKGQILLVEDYFAGIDDKLYAGLHEFVRNDSDALVMAEQVCQKKLGLKVDLIVDMGDFLPLPSISNEQVRVILAYSSSSHVNVSEAFGDQAKGYRLKVADFHSLKSVEELTEHRWSPKIDGATLAAVLRSHAAVAGIPEAVEVNGPLLLGYMMARESLTVPPEDVALFLDSPFKENSRDTTDWERGIRIFERVQKALDEVTTWN